eukprot:TRINITY_DN7649_c0_g1_i3.p1 TRINITY_DN7649_c0_g1~~TRINITY_DN7649_c0_g1_i3.p1  ORF type:complete len:207 (+),score=27.91 TRINITY_DN7649_c0_g1_i3:27-623(+)
MIRRPPRSTRKESSAASDVYKRQPLKMDAEFRVKSVESTGDKVPSAIFKIEKVAPKLIRHTKQNARPSRFSARFKKLQESKINEGGIKRRLRKIDNVRNSAMRKKEQEVAARKRPKKKHRSYYKNTKRASERHKKNLMPFTEQRLAASAKANPKVEPMVAATLNNTENLPIIVRPIFKFLRMKQCIYYTNIPFLLTCI